MITDVNKEVSNLGIAINSINTEINTLSTSIDAIADEEDLTLNNNTSSTNNIKQLKFADKTYNPAEFSGIGRIYLRKNIVDEKNVLIQEMINHSNTRYIIQYDYDLNGQTITIPEKCVLDFQGGSFRNGNIIFNTTKLLYSKDIIFYNCKIKGFITEICVDIFDSVTSDLVNELFDVAKIIYFTNEEYFFSSSLIIKDTSTITKIQGINNKLHFTSCDGIQINKVVTIDNLGLYGENAVSNWSEVLGKFETSYNGIIINKKSILTNITIYTFGVGIMFGNTHIVGGEFKNILIAYCKNFGIYLEHSYIAQKNNLSFDRLYIVKCGKGADDLTGNSTKLNSGIGFYLKGCYCCSITNSVFEYNTGCGLYIDSLESSPYSFVQGLTLSTLYFERNKYANLALNLLAMSSNVLVKSMFFTEANNNPVEDALPSRTIAFMNNRGINLRSDFSIEGFTNSDFLKPIDNFVRDYTKLSAYSGFNIINDTENNLAIHLDAEHRILTQNDFFRATNLKGFYQLKIRYKGAPDKRPVIVLNIAGKEQISISFYGNSSIKTVFSQILKVDNYTDNVVITGIYVTEGLVENEYLDIYSIEIIPIVNEGSSALRPSLVEENKGFQYFDTTLNKPIWWTGTEWVDAGGAEI